MESSLKDEVRLMAQTCEAVYVRVPEAIQVPSASMGRGTCGNGKESGKWDAVLVPTHGTTCAREGRL